MSGGDAAARRSLEALNREFDNATTAINAVEDPEEGFRLATELTEILRVATNSAAELRVQRVGLIWNPGEMSLAGLASRIGVSKARAEQLVKSLKRAKEADVD